MAQSHEMNNSLAFWPAAHVVKERSKIVLSKETKKENLFSNRRDEYDAEVRASEKSFSLKAFFVSSVNNWEKQYCTNMYI